MIRKPIRLMTSTEKATLIRLASEKQLVTTREAALLIGTNEDTIRRYIAKGYIKEGVVATRIGKDFRILREELLTLAIEGKLIGASKKKEEEIMDAAITNS